VKSLYYYRDKYVRAQPSAFCPGCGGGIILQCFLRAIDDLGIDKESILAVSGIGCSAWIPSPYFDGDTLHTTHGRAIAFATGAKAYNPDLTTVVFTGDGDGAGIGGNHLIHAARRNIDLKVFLVNNFSYAMTGGQIAPTTLHGETTVTSPYGNPESPFDITRLVKAAGATYVAKWSTYHVVELTNAMKEALQHKGFAFIEILSQCPTQQRRVFNLRGPLESLPPRILEMFGENVRSIRPEVGPEKLPRICCGEFVDILPDLVLCVSPGEIGVRLGEPCLCEAVHDFWPCECLCEEDDFGILGLYSGDEPVPEPEGLCVRIVHPEYPYPVFDPEEEHLPDLIP